METPVRLLRPVVLVPVLSLLVVVVAAALFLPTLLFKLAGRGSDDSERQARTEIQQHVDAYAPRVVAASTGPAGPSTADLHKLALDASLVYAPERSSDALTTLWVAASAPAGGLFGPHQVLECYTITFHALGTADAASQITHLPNCKPVTDRIAATQANPRPTAS
jgi:hypothetical protein